MKLNSDSGRRHRSVTIRQKEIEFTDYLGNSHYFGEVSATDLFIFAEISSKVATGELGLSSEGEEDTMLLEMYNPNRSHLIDELEIVRGAIKTVLERP